MPELGGLAIPKLYIEMDRAGLVKADAQALAGKVTGQPARTREVKLGCVVTQTSTDKEGRPVRDPGSTTYVGAIQSAEQFGLRLSTEAWRHGEDRASLHVVFDDGAVWIWNLADQHLPGAIQIGISTMRASTCGTSPPNCSPKMRGPANVGWRAVWPAWRRARLKPC